MDRRTKVIFLCIIAISISLRVGAAIYLGNQVEELPGTADQLSYHGLALRVLEGSGFSFAEPWWPATAAGAPTAHWSYLYTFYLVLIYWIFGPNPLIARVLQAILVGIFHPYLALLIGSHVFSRSIGLAAAGLTAIYGYFIYYAGTLMTEPFYITFLLVSLYLSMYITSPNLKEVGGSHERQHYLLSALFGICLGITVLLRQLFLLVIPILFAWIFFATYRYRKTKLINTIALSGLIVLLMILPFTIYNYLRFEQFVLLNTNSGYAFFWGNHPIHGNGFIPILPSATYLGLIPGELRNLNEAALDSALLRRGIAFVFDDPIRYVYMSINRIPAYFKFWPSADSSLISNISRVTSFGLFLPLMLFGFIKSLRFRKYQSTTIFIASPLALLILFIGVYSAIHLLTWALIRYRLPVDAVLILFAGISIIKIFRFISFKYSSTQNIFYNSETLDTAVE